MKYYSPSGVVLNPGEIYNLEIQVTDHGITYFWNTQKIMFLSRFGGNPVCQFTDADQHKSVCSFGEPVVPAAVYQQPVYVGNAEADGQCNWIYVRNLKIFG